MSRRPPSSGPRTVHGGVPSSSSAAPPCAPPPLTARGSAKAGSGRGAVLPVGSPPSSTASPGALGSTPTSSSSSASRWSLKLVHVREDGAAEEHALKDARVTIGRSRASVVCLAKDGQVSNVHAEIVNGFITDLGSTNGTTVNEQPVSPASHSDVAVFLSVSSVSSSSSTTPPSLPSLPPVCPTLTAVSLCVRPCVCRVAQLLPRKATRLVRADVIRCGTTELRVGQTFASNRCTPLR